MLRILSVAAASLTALAACASTAPPDDMSESAAARLTKFERTGETESCVSIRNISQIDPLSESLFLVRVGAGRYYLNEVNGRCNRAGSGFTRLQYTTSLSQLCRNEIVEVRDNSSGFVLGSCSLGTFERVEKKPKTE